jgi:hypothetical protein
MEASKEIAEIEIRIQDHEKRISELEKLLQAKPDSVSKKISIKEFVLTKNATDDQRRTLTIGYFLEKYGGNTSFNITDINKGFRDARIKPPQNINDKVNKNIAKGYMMEAVEEKDNKKAWVLTSTGEKIIESNFSEG